MEIRPKDGWHLKRDSFSKLIVWFADGNIRTLYSIDWKSKYSKQRNPQLGLKRFKGRITKYGISALNIEIYDMATDKLIAKYREGKEVLI